VTDLREKGRKGVLHKMRNVVSLNFDQEKQVNQERTMSEYPNLYVTILQFIGQTMPFNDLRNKITFAWAIVGLLRSKSIHPSEWLLYRRGPAKAASKARQFARWLHNDKIKPNEIYHNLACAVALNWADQPLEVALDTSVLWERYVIVRLAAIYRGRALPLAWKVLTQPSASVSFENYADLLTTAHQLIPASCPVTLLADRGFMDVELMKRATALGWHFIIRTKMNIWVYRAFQAPTQVSRLLPPQGHIRLYHTLQVTARRFGPIHLALGHVRTQHGYEKWALLSDLPTALSTFEQYALRFDIEENFLDDKSAGFQLEASLFDDADALARLCLLLATATLYLVSTGTAVVAMNLRPLVDTHWQRGLSYFQLGWRYLLTALAHAHRLLTFLWLDPGPDPHPAFASHIQAQLSTFVFSAIYCCD
jgi:hypothetical protein